MKNEIKLNIHLFFPEQQNDDISVEQHKAFETLLALPELDQEDSVEKFTTELESRFALIKPILGAETEELLGYSPDDITKLSDFFAGKFKRFGMDAVAVQKILRNIWLQTPCEDKRLNYDLYEFIDEKFYAIVNERKRNISFDHIPAPTDSQWETLKKDWEARRAYYADQLQIDIEYLNGEAVDGTIFPSASGLFANPAPLKKNEPDYAILEFLNFWMTYLVKSPFDFLKGGILKIDDFEKLSVEKLIYIDYFKFVSDYLKKLNTNVTWLQFYKKYFKYNENTFPYNILLNYNNESKIIPHLDSLAKAYRGKQINYNVFWRESRQMICSFFRQRKFPPLNFWIISNVFPDLFGDKNILFTLKSICSTGSHPITEYYADLQQLPIFVNSCVEHIVRNGQIEKTYVEFSLSGTVHFPDIYIPGVLEEYTKIFEILGMNSIGHLNEIEINSHNIVQISKNLDNYFRNFYRKLDPPRELRCLHSDWYEFAEECRCNKKIFALKIFKRYVDFFENEELAPLIKIDLIEKLADFFESYEGSESLDYVISEEENLICHILDVIEKLKEENEHIPVGDVGLSGTIKYFYERDNFEKQQVKLKLQAKEAETRSKILDKMSHSIGNLLEAVDSPLSNIKACSPSDQINSYADDAERGTQLIREIARVMLTIRDVPGGWQWQNDFNTPDGIAFVSILFDSLRYSVNNMFNGKHFKKFNENYFPVSVSDEEYEAAERLSKSANSLEELGRVLNKYFFNYSISISPAFEKIKIGNDDYTATKFTMLLNEILINAIKYASFVEREKRFLYIEITCDENSFTIKIQNSAFAPKEIQNMNGVGTEIIETFVKLFGATKDIEKGHDKYTVQINFQLKKEK